MYYSFQTTSISLVYCSTWCTPQN